MATASWEDARRCPKCEFPGQILADRPGNRAGQNIIVLRCANDERCEMGGENWVVQKNRDGTIPVRAKGDKEFPKRPPDFGATERRLAEELAASRVPNAEVRRN